MQLFSHLSHFLTFKSQYNINWLQCQLLISLSQKSGYAYWQQMIRRSLQGGRHVWQDVGTWWLWGREGRYLTAVDMTGVFGTHIPKSPEFWVVGKWNVLFSELVVIFWTEVHVTVRCQTQTWKNASQWSVGHNHKHSAVVGWWMLPATCHLP